MPYPRRLAVLKQLAHSVVLAWEPPPEHVELCGYHVCVNGELRQALGSGAPPTAVLENLDLQAGPLRVSVQALTSRGGSDPLRCCLQGGCHCPTGRRGGLCADAGRGDVCGQSAPPLLSGRADNKDRRR